jgi:hypothetical protein
MKSEVPKKILDFQLPQWPNLKLKWTIIETKYRTTSKKTTWLNRKCKNFWDKILLLENKWEGLNKI